MKLILKENVTKLGAKGDVVEVSAGFARNYLLPRNLAVFCTEGNLSKVAQSKKTEAKQKLELLQKAKELAEKIEKITCTIRAKAGDSEKLFGSITTQDIADALKLEQLEIDKKVIELDKPIKELGLYHVPIRLGNEVVPKLKVWVVKE